MEQSSFEDRIKVLEMVEKYKKDTQEIEDELTLRTIFSTSTTTTSSSFRIEALRVSGSRYILSRKNTIRTRMSR